jgi:hypothetical protein
MKPRSAGHLHVEVFHVHLAKPQQYAIAWALFPVVVVWLLNGFYMAALARISVPLFWLADVVQWIVLPITLLATLSKKASLLPKNYGLDISALRWQSPIMGTLAVFVTTGLALSMMRNLAWELLGQPTGFFSWSSVFPQGMLGTIAWLYSAFAAGIVESIFFIGLPWLLYHNVRRDPSRAAFTLVSSVVFALAHWEQGPHVVIGAYFANVVACFWFFELGTLWPVAAGHILVDLVAL